PRSSLCWPLKVFDLIGFTHKLEHVPVKDVVVGKALSVEEVPEELPQVGVVWLIVEPQRAAEVQLLPKSVSSSHRPSCTSWLFMRVNSLSIETVFRSALLCYLDPNSECSLFFFPKCYKK
uniref:Uncharacterized protein n=1 Tax=Neogobius melanostomus TaxID=47308 RepID=A0A8C6WGI4_9GOBI